MYSNLERMDQPFELRNPIHVDHAGPGHGILFLRGRRSLTDRNAGCSRDSKYQTIKHKAVSEFRYQRQLLEVSALESDFQESRVSIRKEIDPHPNIEMNDEKKRFSLFDFLKTWLEKLRVCKND